MKNSKWTINLTNLFGFDKEDLPNSLIKSIKFVFGMWVMTMNKPKYIIIGQVFLFHFRVCKKVVQSRVQTMFHFEDIFSYRQSLLNLPSWNPFVTISIFYLKFTASLKNHLHKCAMIRSRKKEVEIISSNPPPH